MNKHRLLYPGILAIAFLMQGTSCAAPKAVPADIKGSDRPIAFPGAEGFGKFTTGGRGGKVYIVSNLNDKGPGSLRDAVNNDEAKTIVFSISGTIHLQSKLNIKGSTTIAGQTAPGDGICLADYPVSLAGDNIIVRYLRIRMGDRFQNQGMVDGAGGDDAFGGTRRKNIIIDHCSVSWSTDEVMSVYAGDSTTLQWNLIAEPLNYSYHFEKGDTDFEHHGYGGIWGGRHTSAHHNLFAHCANRTPRFDGIRNAPAELVDYRNNVIYNWVNNNVYAGEGGNYNIVNNYYKYGPSTNNKVKYRVCNPYKTATIPYGSFYINGNYVDGSPEVTANNWLGVVMEKGTEADAVAAKAANPFTTIALPMQPAETAYHDILIQVGAVLPRRDTLDERIVMEVSERKGNLVDVQGGFPHGTDYSVSYTAWPVLQSAQAPADSDRDGMPDDWEKANKLQPNNPADAVAVTMHPFYTNLEVYVNSLVK